MKIPLVQIPSTGKEGIVPESDSEPFISAAVEESSPEASTFLSESTANDSTLYFESASATDTLDIAIEGLCHKDGICRFITR